MPTYNWASQHDLMNKPLLRSDLELQTQKQFHGARSAVCGEYSGKFMVEPLKVRAPLLGNRHKRQKSVSSGRTAAATSALLCWCSGPAGNEGVKALHKGNEIIKCAHEIPQLLQAIGKALQAAVMCCQVIRGEWP